MLAILPGFGENSSMAEDVVDGGSVEVDDRLFAVTMGPPQKSATPSRVPPKKHYSKSVCFTLPLQARRAVLIEQAGREMDVIRVQ